MRPGDFAHRAVLQARRPWRGPVRPFLKERDDRTLQRSSTFARLSHITLGFIIRGFWAGRESPIFGVWAASAAPKTIPDGGGRRPPPFGIVFGAARATQTPNIDDFRPAQQPCIKNPSVGTPSREHSPEVSGENGRVSPGAAGFDRLSLQPRRPPGWAPIMWRGVLNRVY
jgi:hypothetical protein